MNLLVAFLVSFLLGVMVRALWIMLFPLDMTAALAGQSSNDITEVTFRTLMSLLWCGLLVAGAGSLLFSAYLLIRRLFNRKAIPERT
ncbi:hypothetical protein [Deinococcus roseus]|uniref:Uncharacterized protein n=1 Tax=Deinococcus roseus TaxID=392414 RepID=A0ABQ2DBA0_9DEIO|nr:hypothetical protein [Deinococcus roseus]GGJ49979.1 hypothetical protein GCM10008938_39920 [Deinococcus roseus]